jgi:AcrR family transcriptional regulator
MSSPRRMGPQGSAIWNSMLDAAHDILREQGYSVLTSRSIAERIGVKQRLVYYYFRTMDELVVETFKRGATSELERLRKALASRYPLKEVWDVCVHTADTRITSEFMALANRNSALREEVIKHIEACRKMQVAALSQAMENKPFSSDLTALAATIFATSAALTLHREAQLGTRMGHADIMAAIEGFIAKWDAHD